MHRLKLSYSFAVDLRPARADLDGLSSLKNHQGSIECLLSVTPAIDEFSPQSG